MYVLYIGANNQTGLVEKGKILEIMNSTWFQEYTLIDSEGYWYGKREPSVILQIQADKAEDAIRDLAAEFKVRLRQEAIGLQIIPDVEFV